MTVEDEIKTDTWRSVRKRAEAAEARVKELERVLGMVEWVHGTVRTYCPWCHGEWTDHLENCPRQVALGSEEDG